MRGLCSNTFLHPLGRRATARAQYDDGQTRIQLATFNFLGFIGDPDIEVCTYGSLARTGWSIVELMRTARQKRAIEAILHYGVGSCGPRGFYGSIGVCTCVENEW